MSLEFYGVQWLKFEKRCPLVIHERSPRPFNMGNPDVLGVTDNRYLLEIEIKRTVSDFRANAKKSHIQRRTDPDENVRNKCLENAAKQFWFLVPTKIAEKIQAEVPEWAGLLVHDPNLSGWGKIQCIKKAPMNNLSKKLSLLNCAKLLRNVGNQIYSLMESRHNMIAGGYQIDPHAMDNYYSQKLEFTGQRHEWVPNPDYLNFQI